MTPFLSNYAVEWDPVGQVYVYLDADTGSYLPFTAAMNQAALDKAAETALDNVGLYGVPKNEWTGEDAANYIREFRGLILNYPERFTAEVGQIATRINLGAVTDYQGFNPNALVDINKFILNFTTVTNDAFMMVAQPLAQIPATLSSGLQSILRATENTARGFANTSALGEYIVPLALVGFVWFAVQSAGRDPGGQFSKAVGAFR